MFTEKIELVLVKRKLTKAQLAEKIHISPQNMYNKMKRDNFTEADMQKIAKALDCKLNITMTLNDTGDKF